MTTTQDLEYPIRLCIELMVYCAINNPKTSNVPVGKIKESLRFFFTDDEITEAQKYLTGSMFAPPQERMMTEEILPCPFCGNDPIGPKHAYDCWYIDCENCHYDVDNVSKRHLIKIWNSRPEEENLKKQVTYLEDKVFDNLNVHQTFIRSANSYRREIE